MAQEIEPTSFMEVDDATSGAATSDGMSCAGDTRGSPIPTKAASKALAANKRRVSRGGGPSPSGIGLKRKATVQEIHDDSEQEDAGGWGKRKAEEDLGDDESSLRKLKGDPIVDLEELTKRTEEIYLDWGGKDPVITKEEVNAMELAKHQRLLTEMKKRIAESGLPSDQIRDLTVELHELKSGFLLWRDHIDLTLKYNPCGAQPVQKFQMKWLKSCENVNGVKMAIFQKEHRAVYDELSMNLMAEQGVFEKCADGLTVEKMDTLFYHEDNAVDKKQQYVNKKTEDCLDVQIKKCRKLSRTNEENCWGQECAKLTQAFVGKPLWSENCKEKLVNLDCMFRLVDHPDGTPLEDVVAKIVSKSKEPVYRTVACDENVGMVIIKGAMVFGKANSADRQITTEFATAEEFVISNDAETIKKDPIGAIYYIFSIQEVSAELLYPQLFYRSPSRYVVDVIFLRQLGAK